MAARPLIVAHRGASFDAPENTLAAFRLAFEQGADAIEGDFRPAADGHLVCCHDATTARCGDRDLTIARSTLAALRTVDVGAWKSPAYAGERVPTLAEVLAVVPEGRGVFVELKGHAGASVPLLADTLDRSAVPRHHVRVIAFDLDTVRQTRRLLPDVATSWLVAYAPGPDGGVLRPTAEEVRQVLAAEDVEGLGTEARAEVGTPEFVGTVRSLGKSFHAWTIDVPELAEQFAALGVDSITTNRPGVLCGRILQKGLIL